MRCDEGKKAFATHAAATKAVIAWSWGATYGKNGRRAGKIARTPIRVYRCPHCSLYHYTSHREHSGGRAEVTQVWGPPKTDQPTIAQALDDLRRDPEAGEDA